MRRLATTAVNMSHLSRKKPVSVSSGVSRLPSMTYCHVEAHSAAPVGSDTARRHQAVGRSAVVPQTGVSADAATGREYLDVHCIRFTALLSRRSVDSASHGGGLPLKGEISASAPARNRSARAPVDSDPFHRLPAAIFVRSVE